MIFGAAARVRELGQRSWTAAPAPPDRAKAHYRGADALTDWILADSWVTGNVVRGTGTGAGLSCQRGSNQLTVASSGDLVTDVTTQRSVGTGVTLTAGV
ncbi:hypothetical protein AB0K12_20945 [Nonomuraea sp. NPDC049419]|uniref:hypothetical protein n=1 Tax=Nonomuraea sp. NPDC049419 TaxID=3155772 RepID=UPI0034209056